MTGRTNPLAALFSMSRDATEWERDEILGHPFTACAVDALDHVAVIGPRGRLFAMPRQVQGAAVYFFTWHAAGRAEAVTFWFNASSVRNQVQGWRDTLPRVPMVQVMASDRTVDEEQPK